MRQSCMHGPKSEPFYATSTTIQLHHVLQASSVATVNITFKPANTQTDRNATVLPLRACFRIPTWAPNATLTVNGVAWHGCLGADFGQRPPLAGTFCSVQRTFQAGDQPICNTRGWHLQVG